MAHQGVNQTRALWSTFWGQKRPPLIYMLMPIYCTYTHIYTCTCTYTIIINAIPHLCIENQYAHLAYVRSVCLPASLTVRLPVSLYVRMSASPSLCPSVCLPVVLFTCLFLFLSVCPSAPVTQHGAESPSTVLSHPARCWVTQHGAESPSTVLSHPTRC